MITANQHHGHETDAKSAENLRSFTRVGVGVVILVVLITLATSCSTYGGKAEKTAPLAAPAAPFVEALLEYTGPPERWAGPKTVTLHLLARDQKTASVYLTPSFLPETGRVPQIAARSEIEELAQAIDSHAPEFSGCLYPIRARLIRADGSILEREGCRGNQGWPGAVSRGLSNLIKTAFVDEHPSDTRVASAPGR